MGAGDDAVYRAATAHFREAMLYKLRKHADKGPWKTMSIPYLLQRAKEEIQEVEEALAQCAPQADVENECADVANLLMMLADNYKPQETPAMTQDSSKWADGEFRLFVIEDGAGNACIAVARTIEEAYQIDEVREFFCMGSLSFEKGEITVEYREHGPLIPLMLKMGDGKTPEEGTARSFAMAQAPHGPGAIAWREG